LSKAIEQEEKLSRSNFLSSAIYLESCFFLLSNQTAFSQGNISTFLQLIILKDICRVFIYNTIFLIGEEYKIMINGSNAFCFAANYAKQLPINLGVRGGVLVLITLLLLLL